MTANRYKELKDRQQETFDSFAAQYCFFAFSDAQFQEGMKKLNLDPETDKKKIASFYGGGFVLADHAEELRDLLERFGAETREQIAADPTGDGFILDMFEFELANHEFTYTGDVNDAIEACGLTAAEIDSSEPLRAGLEKAVKNLMEVEL